LTKFLNIKEKFMTNLVGKTREFIPLDIHPCPKSGDSYGAHTGPKPV
jgi:hypothetical protein